MEWLIGQNLLVDGMIHINLSRDTHLLHLCCILTTCWCNISHFKNYLFYFWKMFNWDFIFKLRI